MGNKKSMVISIRMPEDSYAAIKDRAEKEGQSVSRFMTEASIADAGLTQSRKQQLYFHINKMKDLARNACGKIEKELLAECDALWQMLK